MTIYLRAPDRDPGGPDGRGWNRLRIESFWLDECALKPHTWQGLLVAQTDTRFARYGNCGPCGLQGNCGDCPFYRRFRTEKLTIPDLSGGAGRILAILPPPAQRHDVRVRLTAGPGQDWENSPGPLLDWYELPRLSAGLVDRPWSGEDSEGFWLILRKATCRHCGQGLWRDGARSTWKHGGGTSEACATGGRTAEPREIAHPGTGQLGREPEDKEDTDDDGR